MRRIILFLCCLPIVHQLTAQKRNSHERYEVQTPFNDQIIPPAPDYTDYTNWAALPQKNDAADTVPKGLTDNQKDAVADVFFIHPTTYIHKPDGAYHWNADIRDSSLNKRTDHSTIRYQATVFNGACRVYAPRYRQSHLSVFYTPNRSAANQSLALAYTDVKSAFLYYINHFNSGRPFIIASHSQGTTHAQKLIKYIIETDSLLLKQFICAYIIGMPVPADSFNLIKPCINPDDIGCFCSWSTFQYGYYPAWYSISQKNAAVINPISWRADSIPAGADANKGAVLQNFEQVKPGICDATVYKGMLWIHRPKIPFARTLSGGNYHIGDYNLFYMNIRENVAERINTYLKHKR